LCGRAAPARTSFTGTSFRGEDATVAVLHDGPVKDFNVMTSRRHCNASVSSAVHAKESTLDVDTDILLLYAVAGELTLRAQDIESLNIPPGHLCVVRDPASGSMHCHGASYIATQITHHQSTGDGAA